MLLVHHTGKDKKEIERGSSALRGAADVMILLRQRDGIITISNNKQKDSEEFENIEVRLKQVAVGKDAKGRELTSCVLVSTTAKQQAEEGGSVALNSSERLALKALSKLPGAMASSSEWRKAVSGPAGKDVQPKSFDNWRKALRKLSMTLRHQGRSN